MGDTPDDVRPLDESTWPAFATLVEADNGIFGKVASTRDRKIGKHRWVVSTTVHPSGSIREGSQ